MLSWLATCAAHAERLGLPPSAVEPLLAFGGDRSAAEGPAPARPLEPPRAQRLLDAGADPAAFGGLSRASAGLAARLPSRIESALAREVDAAQAAMFARRFVGVRDRLAQIPGPEAALLSVGLARRTAEVLEGPAPRALRVRAVADFYYSRAATLFHRLRRGGALVPTIEALVAGAQWREVGPGLRWARVRGDTEGGPVHINALRARGARLEALDCRGEAAGGDLTALAAARGADAAVSGGFFLYSEPDIAPPSRRTDPVGLLIEGGALRSPPIWSRSALIQRADGGLEIAAVGMAGAQIRWGAGSLEVIAVNDPSRLGEGPVAFNRAFGERSPTGPGAALVGHQIVTASPRPLPIPLAGCVVVSQGPLPALGPVEVALPLDARAAMAGGPRLLRGGSSQIELAREHFAGGAPPITFSRDETFDQNLLPRMAAGLTADGELIFAAIDGRNFHEALGMTLRQTASLCAALGCVEAMNLDGGSSKRMVIDGAVVDLPSTEVVAGAGAGARVRPVHSAILLFSGGARR